LDERLVEPQRPPVCVDVPGEQGIEKIEQVDDRCGILCAPSLEEGLDHRELLGVPAAALAIGGGVDLPQTFFFLGEVFAEEGKETIHDTGCDGFSLSVFHCQAEIVQHCVKFPMLLVDGGNSKGTRFIPLHEHGSTLQSEITAGKKPGLN
jgi:hypothetical protein